MKTITEELAYRAMLKFLENYYNLTGTDDMGALLGCLQLLDDGTPADAAVWDEWQSAIRAVIAEQGATLVARRD